MAFRPKLGVVKKNAPTVSDPRLKRVVDTIYKDINALSDSIHLPSGTHTFLPRDGSIGDMRLYEGTGNEGSTGYFMQGRFKDGWGTVQLTLETKNPENVDTAAAVDGQTFPGYITKYDVTYGNLIFNDDVGTGANQVAKGTHNHDHQNLTNLVGEYHALSADAGGQVTLEASVGLASTWARSDHGHLLRQDIAPQWTAEHQFHHDVRIGGTNFASRDLAVWLDSTFGRDNFGEGETNDQGVSVKIYGPSTAFDAAEYALDIEGHVLIDGELTVGVAISDNNDVDFAGNLDVGGYLVVDGYFTQGVVGNNSLDCTIYGEIDSQNTVKIIPHANAADVPALKIIGESNAAHGQLRVGYSESMFFDLKVDTSGNLLVDTIGNIQLLPEEGDDTPGQVLPKQTLLTDLGDFNRMFRSLFVGEIYAETLVAQDVLATIGGRISVAPTTMLEAPIDMEATSIVVRHNIFDTGDFAIMKSAPMGLPQTEIFEITNDGDWEYSKSTQTNLLNLEFGSTYDTYQDAVEADWGIRPNARITIDDQISQYITELNDREFSAPGASNWANGTSQTGLAPMHIFTDGANNGADETTYFSGNYIHAITNDNDTTNRQWFFLAGTHFNTGMVVGRTYRLSYSLEVAVSNFDTGKYQIGFSDSNMVLHADAFTEFSGNKVAQTIVLDFVFDGTSAQDRLICSADIGTNINHLYIDNVSIIGVDDFSDVSAILEDGQWILVSGTGGNAYDDPPGIDGAYKAMIKVDDGEGETTGYDEAPDLELGQIDLRVPTDVFEDLENKAFADMVVNIGPYTYNVDRSVADIGLANHWQSGDAIMNLGHEEGDGFIELTSTETAYQDLGPSITLYARDDTSPATWNGAIPVVSFGQLRSFVDYNDGDLCGLAVGKNLYTSTASGFEGITADPIKGVRLFNTELKMYTGTDLMVHLETDGNFRIGSGLSVNDPIDYTAGGTKFSWDGTTIRIKGDIEITEGEDYDQLFGPDGVIDLADDLEVAQGIIQDTLNSIVPGADTGMEGGSTVLDGSMEYTVQQYANGTDITNSDLWFWNNTTGAAADKVIGVRYNGIYSLQLAGAIGAYYVRNTREQGTELNYIPIVTGMKINLEARVFSLGAAGAKIGLSFYDADKNLIVVISDSSVATWGTPAEANDWRYRSGAYTVPSALGENDDEPAYFVVTLISNPNMAGVNHWFDDVRCTLEVGLAFPVIPDETRSGLYLGSNYLGFWTGEDTPGAENGEWTVFMNSDGEFQCGPTTAPGDNFLQWTGTELNIGGVLNVLGGGVTDGEDGFTSFSEIESATVNFNTGNDMNGDAITNPAIENNGTAIDHTINTDSSCDLSFEWEWEYDEDLIDGFIVWLHRSNVSGNEYVFGTDSDDENAFFIPYDKRALVITGIPQDTYYHFGVQAYRSVNTNIAPTGFIYSSIVQCTLETENPYQPSDGATPAFDGDITGTIDGTDAAAVVSDAALGASANQDSTTTILAGDHTGQVGGVENEDLIAGMNDGIQAQGWGDHADAGYGDVSDWGDLGALTADDDVSVDGGSLIIGNTSGSAIYSSGKVTYSNGAAGFWMGRDGNAFKLSIGTAGLGIKWNGSSFSVSGILDAFYFEAPELADMQTFGDVNGTKIRTHRDPGNELTDDDVANFVFVPIVKAYYRAFGTGQLNGMGAEPADSFENGLYWEFSQVAFGALVSINSMWTISGGGDEYYRKARMAYRYTYNDGTWSNWYPCTANPIEWTFSGQYLPVSLPFGANFYPMCGNQSGTGPANTVQVTAYDLSGGTVGGRYASIGANIIVNNAYGKEFFMPSNDEGW